MPLAPPAAPVIVVMGVSGVGKTTVAEALAERLGWPYRDGDSFHPPENVAKMRAGTPLTDTDRWPWLAAIEAWIAGHRDRGEHAIVACSALRRAYRDRLRNGHSDVAFVYLHGDRETIAARMQARQGHYMPTSLLDSQFATLEPPGPDENVVAVDVALSPHDEVDVALAGLAAWRPGRPRS